MAPLVPTASLGRRRRGAAAKGAVAAVVLLARDTLEGTALRIKGLSEWARHIQPKDLAAEWRVAAEAPRLPKREELAWLYAATLSGWAHTSLSDKVLMLDAWGWMQTQHKAFELPRPLLRRVADALWAEHGEASLFELNLAAARAADFLSTRAADLARSILDAVIHACADHVRRDPKQAAHMRQAINVGHHASRKPRVQGELVLLRAAASASISPLEQAIQERVGITKLFFGVNSMTARTHVAASLARDSMEHGGDVRTTFIKVFGHAPEEHVEAPVAAAVVAAETALEGWRHSTRHRLAKEAHAEGVQPSGASVITVHGDGRADMVAAAQAAVLAAAAEEAAEEAAAVAAEVAAKEAAEEAAADEEEAEEAAACEEAAEEAAAADAVTEEEAEEEAAQAAAHVALEADAAAGAAAAATGGDAAGAAKSTSRASLKQALRARSLRTPKAGASEDSDDGTPPGTQRKLFFIR